ncbi:mercuric reductase [Kockovaella imperatae]|uniref:Mercuric reductase n=1 Tax=Kockovaella imperatae TaxID=4999 RepID=A0A1Y1ULV6_9TREE|nr:mercuric reductase [Kockovaella imperatae]ORX39031.1 mercuric reductase [Kockovaella imperatae]
MTSLAHYDVVVIGSGQGGTPLCQAFVKSGLKTALIESRHVGGCCVNEGCSPTKTMIASGRVAYLVNRAKEYGVNIKGEITVDQRRVKERKQEIVDSFREGGEKTLKESGVDLLTGVARFLDSKTIAVIDTSGQEIQRLTADKIFVNTGERPVEPPIDGLKGEFAKGVILDSTSIQELDVVPEHLVVVGGGYIGIEFGQLFRRLGSAVSVIQRGRQLFPREDREVAEAVKNILEEDGLAVYLQTAVQSISPGPEGCGATVLYKTESGDVESLNASHVLIATGRRPNTDELNLEAASVKLDSKGYIKVNDLLETSQSHIWALGDVKGPPAFTHVSYDDYRILKANLIDHKGDPSQHRSIKDRDLIAPYVAYMDPQLAHVGLHEHEARERFPDHTIKTATMPMSYVARALETDETRGLMKAVVDMDTDRILGFTCLGLEGGEIMSVVQMAMMGGTKWTVLQDAVWAHPTLAESLNNLWGFLK